jgi:hypothetical protein
MAKKALKHIITRKKLRARLISLLREIDPERHPELKAQIDAILARNKAEKKKGLRRARGPSMPVWFTFPDHPAIGGRSRR